MEQFFDPLIGGMMIGIAVSLMLWGLGRITGISGILATTLIEINRASLWRPFFILGLVIGGFIMKYIRPSSFEYSFDQNYGTYVIAGLLVGFGTRLGGGCTSGHGICGISRVSKRSIVATITFILFGMMTTTILERISQ